MSHAARMRLSYVKGVPVMRLRSLTLCLVLSAAILLVGAAPASAVLDGERDSANGFSNVGMIYGELPDGSYWWGTCTLVDENVVLTAAHCVDLAVLPGGPGVGALTVSFDVQPTPWDPGFETYYAVDRVVMHPDYVDAPPAGWNSKRWLGPGHEDVALVWLTEAPDIEPATVVGTPGFDALDLKRATFSVAGYGTTGFVAGSYMSWKNPNTQFLWDGRNFREDVRVINDREVFAERYVKMTACTAFGDSGGPTFYGSTVVADTVWGESMRCMSPAYQYRLDAPRAQWFLRQHLDEDRFVALD